MERDELEKLMKEKLAKPDRSLYDHSLGGAMRIARELLRKIPHDPELEDCLLEHVFLHDVGKLDDRFQEKLHGGERKKAPPTLTSGWSWRPASSTAPRALQDGGAGIYTHPPHGPSSDALQR